MGGFAVINDNETTKIQLPDLSILVAYHGLESLSLSQTSERRDDLPDWLATMLIDLAVFRDATKFRTQTLRSRDAIFARICNAIVLFNGNAPVSEDEYEQPRMLRDSITLAIQPKGQGHKPMDMTDLLAEIWGESSIPEPRERDLGVLELLGRLWKKLGI